MQKYTCKKCGAEWWSAGTDKPCECGEVLREIKETGEYKQRVDELMHQGFSLEEAIRKVNGMIGGE